MIYVGLIIVTEVSLKLILASASVTSCGVAEGFNSNIPFIKVDASGFRNTLSNRTEFSSFLWSPGLIPACL